MQVYWKKPTLDISLDFSRWSVGVDVFGWRLCIDRDPWCTTYRAGPFYLLIDKP